jgi:hypothetical protein
VKTWQIVVAATAAFVVIGVGAVSYFAHEPATSAPRPAGEHAREVTLVLHAAGGAESVTYTCLTEPDGVCGPVPVAEPATWHKRVTAPVGTTVRVQARGRILPPWCSITDASDQLVLNEDHKTGMCVTVAQ